MEVKDAEVAAVAVDDDELRDAVGAHEVERVDGVFCVEDAMGVAAHDVGGAEVVDRGVGLEHAPEVAVGDDALYLSVAVGHYGASEAARGHFEDGVADGGVGCDEGALVLAVEVADAHVELFAQGSAGVEAREVAGGEVAAFDECDGEGVAHDELGGGAGGGGEVVGAGFVLDGGVEDDVGLLGEEGVGVADDGDEWVAEVFDEGYEYLDFWGVAALGEADDDIAGLYHAEVAVDGVGGVHEEGRGAGAVEGGDDFGGDVGTFANTGNYDPSRGRKNGFDGVRKAVIDAFGEVFYCFFFICNNLFSNGLDVG